MQLTQQQIGLLDFVKESHGDQTRKYTGDPYWTHPFAVAEIVSQYTDKAGMIEIALCHDLFEDTSVTRIILCQKLQDLDYSNLDSLFILQGVEALTDTCTPENMPHFNRAQRKHMEAIRLGKIHGDYQTIKYADLIHNTESIVEHDLGFAVKYLNEKRQMLTVMRSGNLDLFVECYQNLIRAEAELGIAQC